MAELTKELHIPIRMLKAIIHDLVRCNILSEVLTDKPKVTAFQPAQNIERFSVKFVMEEIDKLGETYLKYSHSENTQKFVEIHDKFFETLEKHSGNVLLKDI